MSIIEQAFYDSKHSKNFEVNAVFESFGPHFYHTQTCGKISFVSNLELHSSVQFHK